MVRAGRRVAPAPTLGEIRQRAARNLTLLPEPLRDLQPAIHPIELGDALIRLTEDVDLRLARQMAHA
jgi:nicotinate phosphoribosyltransferase